ncbi:VOC family protein [Phaeobacter sp. 22II1-1F12B]|uniref:VOC family protein n=1 Tax=Phaeobacter sp. 22II1-1F12B TaxID=1317111 RepID=UPI000B5291FB|nr:VOC family protein [Phaeobacter sp. 22II1-1F12B]OWU72721.1 lactoylglutathione lyase [Phaeobacter sp. 22II1-1F12B]
MFTHVMVGANNVVAMTAFYDAVLAHVGLVRTTEPEETGPAGIIWQCKGIRWPQFALRAPLNGVPASAGNGVLIGFQCGSTVAVKMAWKTALSCGGTDEGPPGDRPVYSDDFYAAYVRDPEGNKLCFLFCSEFLATS